MDAWIAKMICLFLILLLTLMFGLLPIRMVPWIRRRDNSNIRHGEQAVDVTGLRARRALGYLNCISGGVFLAVCLIHLFPEVIEKYDIVKSRRKLTISYPIPELLVSVGFFIIMLIEHGAMSWRKNSHSTRAPVMTREQAITDTEPLLIDHDTTQESYQNGSGEPVRQQSEERLADCHHSLRNSYANQYVCETLVPHHHHPGQTHKQTEQIHGIRSLILLLALSIHTIFEGLALGLETSTRAVWMLFVALAVHKSIISFMMGLQFTDTFQQTSRVLSYMLTFSIMSPIGICIGTAITAVNQGSFGLDISSMTLQGVATGTFLYVTFFEILQKELGVEDHSITKVLAIILGFVLISLTKLVES